MQVLFNVVPLTPEELEEKRLRELEESEYKQLQATEEAICKASQLKERLALEVLQHEAFLIAHAERAMSIKNLKAQRLREKALKITAEQEALILVQKNIEEKKKLELKLADGRQQLQ